MIDKIIGLWTNLTPWTKRIIIIVLGVVLVTLIICAAVTGNMDGLFSLLRGEK